MSKEFEGELRITRRTRGKLRLNRKWKTLPGIPETAENRWRSLAPPAVQKQRGKVGVKKRCFVFNPASGEKPHKSGKNSESALQPAGKLAAWRWSA